ncbi:MAG: hypothetical protein WA089_18245, partial [Anaerolineae bacterium]
MSRKSVTIPSGIVGLVIILLLMSRWTAAAGEPLAPGMPRPAQGSVPTSFTDSLTIELVGQIGGSSSAVVSGLRIMVVSDPANPAQRGAYEAVQGVPP